MLLSLKKLMKRKTQTIKIKNKANKRTTKQTKTVATYNSPCLHHRWSCCQAIALNEQQLGPTPFAPLSP